MYDVTVIGGGVIGGMILRELTKYRLKVCLLEKENDVCMGQSRANSGIVHAGFDAVPGTLKARFNVLGNRMLGKTAAELGVKFSQNGSIVVAYSEEEKETLRTLLERGESNGVTGLYIAEKDELPALEPSLSDDAVAALVAPTGGIVCPYELTIAAIGNAMDNGAELFTDACVCRIDKNDGYFTVITADGRRFDTEIVVNCAGLGSGKVAELVGDDTVRVRGRRGEYILLDRESGGLVKHTVFCTPGAKGKGILVSPTVDGNVILGPTATETDDEEPRTTAEGLAEIGEKASGMVKNVPFYNTITSFAGVRAYSERHDFIIEESPAAKRFINVAGIESPGLTSAPAIAEYVVRDIVGAVKELEVNEAFSGTRTPDNFFKELTVGEKNELIKKDPAYGRIVCRCEEITEGEIVRAIRVNPPARNVDAVKRRTRAGMGRCQGGFCQPSVAGIIARELGIPFEEVTKSGGASRLLTGKNA